MTLQVFINSYISADEADKYFETRLGADFWKNLKDDDKEKALITATNKMDRLTYIGRKLSYYQPLQFPRVFGLCPTVPYLPQKIKDALCEEALTLAQFINSNSEEVFNGAVNQDFHSMQLGGASITFNPTNQTKTLGLYSKYAEELLSGFLKTGFDIPQSNFYEGN